MASAGAPSNSDGSSPAESFSNGNADLVFKAGNGLHGQGNDENTRYAVGDNTNPAAIVGMSCRLPGNANTPEEFWELCSRARSGWSGIPKERFNHSTFHHPNPDKAGCYNPAGGNFLTEDVGLFDAPFFNVTEKEAISMDPQQRLLLECTYEALENGGIPKEKLVGKDVGVFVGGSFADYELNNCRDTDTAPMYQATGCASSVLAGRISYYFDFKGPCFTVDTACSSSLTALHLACQALANGECSYAVVASAHLNLLPDYFVIMSMSSLFSNEGRSFAFDERGNGFGRGEGVGCVVIRPVNDAVKDNDAIRAVLAGTGINQDGRTKGITMPSGDAQVALMKQVYAKSGIDPKDTGFVEAHGTGTKVGDPIEATGLHEVFKEGRTARQPLYIGSVKSNIGHLEGASGVVAVIKSALMLEKGFILPNHDFQKPNPAIPFAEWNLKVPASQRPWPRGKKYISVNNFGFGGTNAHAVLAGPPVNASGKPVGATGANGSDGEKSTPAHDGPVKRVYVLSANDKKSLESQMHRLTIYLEQRPEVFQKTMMPNLAYTLGERRSNLAYRVAVPAWSSAELISSLASSAVVPVRAMKDPKIGFIFTGQGAQWHAMGRELVDAYPVFADSMKRIDEKLASLGADFSMREELNRDEKESKVSEAHISQPACTATQLALVDLLASWGIQPAAVAGHSSGEIAAAYAAGILSLEDSVAAAYYRGQAIPRLKQQHPELKGAMMAVGGGPDEVRPLIKMLKSSGAGIACINSPTSITASGDVEAIDELAKVVEEKQMFNRKLRVDVAYHSHHMELVAESYGQDVKDIKPNTENQKALFHSSLVGRLEKPEALGASYWVQNLTCPVRFSEAVQSMCKPTEEGSSAPGVDMLVEIGPHAALEGPVKQILKAIGGNAVKLPYAATLYRNKNAVDTVTNVAGALFAKGVPVKFNPINFPHGSAKAPLVLTNLPRYSWNHATKYWHEARISDNHRFREFPRSDLLGTLADYSNDLEPTWRNTIKADDMPWVRDHQMQSMSVYPMAGYVAMALEAASQRATLRNVPFDKFELREVSVIRPLVIQEGGSFETNITFRPYSEGTRTSSDLWDEFRIFSWAPDRKWIEHCRGLISVVKTTSNVVHGEQAKSDARKSLQAKIATIKSAPLTPVDSVAMYENLLAIGCGYGPTFQGMENAQADDHHSAAELVHPDTAAGMPLHHHTDFIIHPAFLDQFIQIVWPLFGAGRNNLDLLYMPSFVKSMSVATGISTKPGDRLSVYCTGKPTPANPSPTKLDLFATAVGGGDEILLSMDGLIMTPMLNSDGGGIPAPRELCYKFDWENVVPEEDQQNGKAVESDASAEVAFGGIEVVIIADGLTQSPIISQTQRAVKALTGQAHAPVTGPLGSVETAGKICIVLSELDQPFVASISASGFDYMQNLITTAEGIVWPVRGAYAEADSPDLNMVIGMARSVRSETLLKFATLDLTPGTSDEVSAKMIASVLKNIFTSNSSDMEYREKDGKLMVPRVINDHEMNQLVQQETEDVSHPHLQAFDQPGRPLKIAIENPGALDTLYFVDDKAVGTPLPDYEVEIEIKATSMNFKDIMISMGQLSAPYLGVECSGVISGVGSKVTDLKVGDRVAAMTEGAYATYTRCLGTSAQKMPDAMSFEDASTIPVIYCTAFYSLFDLGRLTKGERVLIHAAAGGVGQAAILLSQMVGAEIFATVGSVAKKEFIMNEYGVPEDHIFFSRDATFGKAIKHATNGEGVDVVLNSLAGNALRETWDSLAHFGRFIEIGKRDITGNTRLEMAVFEHNASFASVDLTVVAAERPKIMKRLLVDVFDLMQKNSIRPIKPITVFPISDVESAFRTLQSGKIMGKIVIVPGAGDQVKAVHAKTSDKLLRSDATYIIIGGTGGLGRSMCRWMISKGGRNFVLLSRSGSSGGKVGELIKEAEGSGTKIVVRACDVSSKEQVEKLVSDDLAGMPAVRGLIHGAMVLDDVLFEKMTFRQWQTVVEGKVAGAWNFHNALQKSELDFFVALSSAAGTVGNRGQAAYSAANCFLNAFVQYRLKNGLPASSIDLTAVSDVGYLAENAEKAAQVSENLGSETVSEKEVLALLGAAITGKMTDICNNHAITGLKLGENPQDTFWINDGKFTHLRLAAEAAQANSGSATATVSLSKALKQAKSMEQAVGLVCDGLMAKVSAVLMVPLEEMDASKAIVVYGLDSLVAIEIRNWITRELEASLQVLELLTSSSITGLAGTILQKSKLVTKELLESGAEGVTA